MNLCPIEIAGLIGRLLGSASPGERELARGLVPAQGDRGEAIPRWRGGDGAGEGAGAGGDAGGDGGAFASSRRTATQAASMPWPRRLYWVPSRRSSTMTGAPGV